MDATLGNLTPDDIKFLNALSARMQQNRSAVATAEETQRLERLVAGGPGVAPVKGLLMGVYLRTANRDLQMGSFDSVDLALGRMKLLDDHNAEVHSFEAHVRVRQEDWAGALAAAQRYEAALGPATVNMSLTLAVALEKTGRRADAQAVLDRPVFDACAQPTGDDVNACLTAADLRRMMAAPTPASNPGPEPGTRTRAALSVDAAKEQIQSERFDIRFDGENQTGVARDVRFVLDRAYVRLADIYYERPVRKIPVVLHSQRDYFSATGAPWWSGGVYSSHNGAIQIPDPRPPLLPSPRDGGHARSRVVPRLRGRDVRRTCGTHAAGGPRSVHGGQADRGGTRARRTQAPRDLGAGRASCRSTCSRSRSPSISSSRAGRAR